eukprot:4563176-Lingulodinium_polyedra.AAC.1
MAMCGQASGARLRSLFKAVLCRSAIATHMVVRFSQPTTHVFPELTSAARLFAENIFMCPMLFQFA